MEGALFLKYRIVRPIPLQSDICNHQSEIFLNRRDDEVGQDWESIAVRSTFQRDCRLEISDIRLQM